LGNEPRQTQTKPDNPNNPTTMKNITLITAKHGLSFELVPKPVRNADLGPKIVVHDGDFRVASYCLSTFRENVAKKQGVCITAGKFEKYRAIESDTLAELVAEADALLSSAPPASASQGTHTPGPWTVQPVGYCRSVIHRASHSDQVVANAYGNEETAAANAAIIAAAPELLAVLKAEAAMFEGRDANEWAPEMADRIRAMRAAIAKATGGAK
jgi:hypothetical protein